MIQLILIGVLLQMIIIAIMIMLIAAIVMLKRGAKVIEVIKVLVEIEAKKEIEEIKVREEIEDAKEKEVAVFDEIAIDDEVEVEGAITPTFRANAAVAQFNVVQHRQQRVSRNRCVDDDNAVEVLGVGVVRTGFRHRDGGHQR